MPPAIARPRRPPIGHAAAGARPAARGAAAPCRGSPSGPTSASARVPLRAVRGRDSPPRRPRKDLQPAGRPRGVLGPRPL